MMNIAIIPARSGSKGLKDKNIINLCGKPLMWYTIQAAKESGKFDIVMVSTDSEGYAEIARACGAEVPFLRSQEQAKDTSGSWDVVREVLSDYSGLGLSFDNVALLQPTSPLRSAGDICGAFEFMEKGVAHSVVSVTQVDHPVQWCFRISAENYITDLANSPYNNCRRQDLEIYYRENGAIYVVDAEKIMEKKYNFYADNCFGYEMPRERSVDIDDAADYRYAAFLMHEIKQRGE